jgi:hypothetical protein
MALGLAVVRLTITVVTHVGGIQVAKERLAVSKILAEAATIYVCQKVHITGDCTRLQRI